MNILLGRDGENIAADYLQKKGYTIIDRNYRYSHFELDIICQLGDLLVVVEVKMRARNSILSPAASISRQKQSHILRATNAYIQKNRWLGEVRLDVIAIRQDGGNFEIEHIENAFGPIA